MGLLNYYSFGGQEVDCSVAQHDIKAHEAKMARNVCEDIKHGIDLICELKIKLEKLHPIASETIIRLVSM